MPYTNEETSPQWLNWHVQNIRICSELDLETGHRPTVSQVKWRQNLNPFKYDTTVPF